MGGPEAPEARNLPHDEAIDGGGVSALIIGAQLRHAIRGKRTCAGEYAITRVIPDIGAVLLAGQHGTLHGAVPEPLIGLGGGQSVFRRMRSPASSCKGTTPSMSR
jgi:hypothetical protein